MSPAGVEVLGSASPLGSFFGPLFAELGIRHSVADAVQLLVLGFARWLPVFTLTPFLGGRLVPTPIKLGLTLLMASWLLPALSAEAPVPLEVGPLEWWILVFKEALVGFVLGFGASLIFWAADMAGRFVDSLRGTTVANLLLPQVPVQTSLLGDFYFQLFVVLYVVAGGHRWFLGAVFDSYRILPAAQASMSLASTVEGFVGATAGLFVVALKIMAPPLAVLMLLDLVLGLANRMAPQLEVFFLSLPLKSAVGALLVALSLYHLVALVPDVFGEHDAWLQGTVYSLEAGGP